MEVVLKIPTERHESKEWILTQPPGVVADIFDVAKELFQFTTSMASVQASSNAQDMARMTQQHLKSLDEKNAKISHLSSEIDEFNSTLESRANQLAKKAIEARDDMHRFEIERLMKQQNEMLGRNEEQLQLRQEKQAEMLTRNHEQIQNQLKDHYDGIIATYKEESTRLKAENSALKSSENSANSHTLDVLRENTIVLKQFTKDVNTGFTGEELVRLVFDEEINTGFLEDTSRSREPGSEDYVWKVNDITASIEVKFKSSIHSIHDMQKHRDRIYEAARMKKINIGIFLSLKCKIPNKPLLSVENVSGIPVIYAAAAPGVSPKQVIHNTFVFASALAKRIHVEDQTDLSYALIDEVVQCFDKFMKSLNKQQDQIQLMRRQVNQNFKCLESLEKIKNEMISNIEGLRTDYACLCPTDDTDSTDGADLLQTIFDFREKHKRYPTNPNQLPEGFVSSQEELDDLVKLAKRGKKRKL